MKRSSLSDHHQPTTTVSDSWYEVFVLICCIIFSVLVFSFFILLQRLVLIKTPTSYYHPYYTKVHVNVTCFSGSLCQIVCVYRGNSYETCENVLRMYVYFCILA